MEGQRKNLCDCRFNLVDLHARFAIQMSHSDSFGGLPAPDDSAAIIWKELLVEFYSFQRKMRMRLDKSNHWNPMVKWWIFSSLFFGMLLISSLKVAEKLNFPSFCKLYATLLVKEDKIRSCLTYSQIWNRMRFCASDSVTSGRSPKRFSKFWTSDSDCDHYFSISA